MQFFFPQFYILFFHWSLSLTYLARTIIKISLSSLIRVIALENNHL